MALCSKPYITLSGQPTPCGQCQGCLVNRKQLWTHRIILESLGHEKNCFVTLTYMDEHLPLNGEGTPTLVKDHLSGFIKKLRTKLPQKLRYYAVGEYGTSGARGINPHYHLCLFNVGEEDGWAIQDSWRTNEGRGKQGEELGFSYTGSLTPKSAAYVAGYVQKKTKYNKDMYDELQILPEYSTMSNRPGIGAGAIDKIAETISEHNAFTPTGDVPVSLYHGSRKLPLGQYMREKLRWKLDLDRTEITEYDKRTGEIQKTRVKWHGKEKQKEIYEEELRLLQENKEVYDPKLPEHAKSSKKAALAYRDGQAIANFEARQKIFSKSGTL